MVKERPSAYRPGPLEESSYGQMVQVSGPTQEPSCRADFVQSIGDHWRHRPLDRNQMVDRSATSVPILFHWRRLEGSESDGTDGSTSPLLILLGPTPARRLLERHGDASGRRGRRFESLTPTKSLRARRIQFAGKVHSLCGAPEVRHPFPPPLLRLQCRWIGDDATFPNFRSLLRVDTSGRIASIGAFRRRPVLVHAGRLNAKAAERACQESRERRPASSFGSHRRRRRRADLGSCPRCRPAVRCCCWICRRSTRRSCRRTSSTPSSPRSSRSSCWASAATGLFIGGADPTDQEAVERIKFADPAHAGMGDRRGTTSSPRVLEATGASGERRRWNRCPAATSSSTSPTKSPRRRGRGGRLRRGRRAGRALPAEDADRRDQRRARVRPALRALRVPLPRALPHRRRTARNHAAADRDQGQARLAHQGHLAAWTSPKNASRRTAA